MCGIAGYIGTRTLEPASLQSCLTRLRLRGPDNAAARQWTTRDGRQAYLLHTRLSIIDLDPRANQPFARGTRRMVYNGELYNYLELREELQRLGEVFQTASDTEVLLAVLDRFGWEGLERCEGMWAFAVYDEADGSLTLCRDRFGEKPLYLLQEAAGWYFGSEPKAITALLGRPLPVNTEHLYRYLVNGYKALYKGPQGFFQGLEQLPRATLLRISGDGSQTASTYWQPRVSAQDGLSYEEAVADVRERLIQAVKIRLRADVPMAFCMSGGVDSNALIGIAKRVFGYDVHGFTIVNSDERYDESELVEAVVRELGIRHTSVALKTHGFLARLREQVRQHEAPVTTISYFVHGQLMEQIAAAGYRISVSGTGADELFTGYYDHHLAYLHAVREDPALHAASRQAWMERIQPLVRNPLLRDPDAFVRNPQLRDHIYFNAEGFAGYLRSAWSEPFAEAHFSGSLLRNRMLNELFHEVVPAILHEDDLNAMNRSIENRSPYLDRGLFDACYRIPSRHLIRDGRAKAVLRDAMRGIVPDRVLDNPRKVGFNAPIHALLDTRDESIRREVLADSPIFEHVHRERIAALLDKPELPNSESKFLFYFLSSKLFLEEFGGVEAEARS